MTDLRLGVRYFLTPDAAWLFVQLRREPHIESLARTVARSRRISTVAAKHAIYTLLGQLDTCGGVRLVWNRPVTRFLHAAVHSHWHARYRGTLGGFLGSMVRAYGLLAIGSGTAFAVCRAAVGPAFPAYWVWLPAALLATCVVHEAGHTLAARWLGVRFILLARPWSAAVMYAEPAALESRLIALAGPMTAVLCCAVGAMLSATIFIQAAWIIASLIHACSLLPSLADGKTIWRNYEKN